MFRLMKKDVTECGAATRPCVTNGLPATMQVYDKEEYALPRTGNP